MSSIVTFDGARGHLGDEWSADAAGGNSTFNDAAWSLLSWGFISFAVSTVALRGFGMFKDRFPGKQHGPVREQKKCSNWDEHDGKCLDGARRRRRRHR